MCCDNASLSVVINCAIVHYYYIVNGSSKHVNNLNILQNPSTLKLSPVIHCMI